jgi:replication-associated recombination protein RarA
MGYQIKTKQGYDFYECSGAIQKGVRRNDEKVALFFAAELFNSGYDEYVWKRLKIMVSEDIGLAEPNMAAHIHALYTFYTDHKKKKDPKKEERIFLTHAIQSLCRAKKSRLSVWTCFTIWRKHIFEKMEVPLFAYDMHNIKGKTMGRGTDHFWHGNPEKNELPGCHLENHIPQEGEAEWKNEAWYWSVRQPKVPWADIEKGETPPPTEEDLIATDLFN